MKEKINLVASIKHIKLSAINQFTFNDAGKCFLTWTAVREIALVEGSASVITDADRPVSGKRWKTTLSARLKKETKDFEPGILLIELESGETQILGDPELPVKVFLPESLTSKAVDITHLSTHKPLILSI